MQSERRRISLIRLVVMIAVLAGSGMFVWSQANAAYSRLTEPPITTWFAPYVDTTLTPTFQFEDPVVSPSPYSVLGFVVADRNGACTPTWGTYFSLDGAAEELDLDRRIARLRARGGDVAVSFGGAINQELAAACPTVPALQAAYQMVIDRYGLRTVDFDIEGPAQADSAANTRRAQAIRAVQKRASHLKRPVVVWLTLPVSPAGLTTDGINVVNNMLTAGVKLGGVNAMIMDYGGSLPGGQSMSDGNNAALHALFKQLKRAYRAVGKKLTDQQLWKRIGATPMIGRNDTDGQFFTISDAQSLVRFAEQVGLGRVSMWSANRDYPCSANQDMTQVSNVCSGVDQDTLAFTWELGRLNAGMPDRVPAQTGSVEKRAPSRDDPRTSPYPIWLTSKVYIHGNKVVWHGTVYEAKWYNQAQVPDQPVAHLWDTPWRALGPVLPEDVRAANAAANLGPRHWASDQVYLMGDKVTDHGYIFVARWWTQGEEPAVHPLRPDSSAWSIVRKIKSKHKPSTAQSALTSSTPTSERVQPTPTPAAP